MNYRREFSSNSVAMLYLLYGQSSFTDNLSLTYTLCCTHADCTFPLIINCISDMQVHLALLHLPMFLLVRMAGPISCVLLVIPQME